MLQDANRRALELTDKVGRGGDIEDVVIAEFLALQLFEGLVEGTVERGLLVRVLAVAEALGDGQGGREAGGQAEDVAGAGLSLGFEVVGDRGVVGGGALEDLEGEFAAEFAKGLSLQANYYNTEQKDVLQVISAQNILNNEALFPERVTRAAASASDIALGQPGQVGSIRIA